MGRRWTLGVAAAVAQLWAGEPAWASDCRSDQSEPRWVTKKPIGYQFDYAVGEGQAASRTDAVAAAIKNGILDLIQTGKIQVEGASEIVEKAEIVHGGGTGTETVRLELKDEVAIKTGATRLEGLETVETFEERCGDAYQARALVRVRAKSPRDGGPPNYYASAWVPSLAQFQKEETGKAIFILVGEGALVGGAIVTFLLSESAYASAVAATRQADRDFYNDRASLLGTTALVTGIAAGALYVYNVLDGMLGADSIHYAARSGLRPALAAGPLDGGGFVALSLGGL